MSSHSFVGFLDGQMIRARTLFNALTSMAAKCKQLSIRQP